MLSSDGLLFPRSDLAADDAEQIMCLLLDGMTHRVGYPAGGWYAHVVAKALLQSRPKVGILAVINTNATARLCRHPGIILLTKRLYSRLGVNLVELFDLSGEEPRCRYLQGQM